MLHVSGCLLYFCSLSVLPSLVSLWTCVVSCRSFMQVYLTELKLKISQIIIIIIIIMSVITLWFKVNKILSTDSWTERREVLAELQQRTNEQLEASQQEHSSTALLIPPTVSSLSLFLNPSGGGGGAGVTSRGGEGAVGRHTRTTLVTPDLFNPDLSRAELLVDHQFNLIWFWTEPARD